MIHKFKMFMHGACADAGGATKESYGSVTRNHEDNQSHIKPSRNTKTIKSHIPVGHSFANYLATFVVQVRKINVALPCAFSRPPLVLACVAERCHRLGSCGVV